MAATGPAATGATDFASLDMSLNQMFQHGENVRRQLNGLSRLPQVEHSATQILAALAELRTGQDEMRVEMRTEIAAVRTEIAGVKNDVQGLRNDLETGIRQLDTRLTALETNVATIQVDISNQSLHLMAQDHNQIARVVNATRSNESAERPLVPMHDKMNNVAVGFPTLVGDLRSLTNHQAGRLLRFYGLTDEGSNAEKAARFATFCGVRGMTFPDCWP